MIQRFVEFMYLAGKEENSMQVIIIAIVVPLGVYVLLFIVISSFYVTTRLKNTYETATADDGRNSKIH